MGRPKGGLALKPLLPSLLALGIAAAMAPSAHAQRALLPSTAQGGGSDDVSGVELDAANRSRVVAFVSAHSSFVGSKVQVMVGRVRQLPPACARDPGLSISGNSRPWGGFTVAMQCASPQWTLMVPVQTKVTGQIVLANRNIAAGSKATSEDFRVETRDITRSPVDAARTLLDVENRQVSRSIAADAVVQLNSFREPTVIKERDTVRVQIVGTGFQVIGEGLALSAGGAGELIRVRMPDGQVLQARVIRQGFVELSK